MVMVVLRLLPPQLQYIAIVIIVVASIVPVATAIIQRRSCRRSTIHYVVIGRIYLHEGHLVLPRYLPTSFLGYRRIFNHVDTIIIVLVERRFKRDKVAPPPPPSSPPPVTTTTTTTTTTRAAAAPTYQNHNNPRNGTETQNQPPNQIQPILTQYKEEGIRYGGYGNEPKSLGGERDGNVVKLAGFLLVTPLVVALYIVLVFVFVLVVDVVVCMMSIMVAVLTGIFSVCDAGIAIIIGVNVVGCIITINNIVFLGPIILVTTRTIIAIIVVTIIIVIVVIIIIIIIGLGAEDGGNGVDGTRADAQYESPKAQPIEHCHSFSPFCLIVLPLYPDGDIAIAKAAIKTAIADSKAAIPVGGIATTITISTNTINPNQRTHQTAQNLQRNSTVQTLNSPHQITHHPTQQLSDHHTPQ
mmetsp:Transcript_8264/g.18552  ORF Transcript_8264/g.18552 Transcript_8264/m.18552 type:complete len:412 (-) Transcript_8264:558-1793(-)